MLPEVISRSRSSAVSVPSILSEDSGGGLTSSTRSTPFAMTTSAPAVGTFWSGQFAGSDHRFTLGGGVSLTGPPLPVGSTSSSRVHAASGDNDRTVTSITPARRAAARAGRSPATFARAERDDIRGYSRHKRPRQYRHSGGELYRFV